MLYPQGNKKRTLTNLDGFWDFYADNSETKFEDVSLLNVSKMPDKRTMAVPASWNDQYEDLLQFHQKGWYERDFYCPFLKDDEDIYLRFGSVSGKAKVWINGNFVTEHIGNALPFEAKITEFVKKDEKNILTVLADNTLDPWSLPPAALAVNEGRMGFKDQFPAVTYDFFPYGGIQRSVYLYTSSKTRIEDVTITTRLGENSATVYFNVEFNKEFSGDINISTDEKTVTVNANGKEACGEIIIENPKLWDIGEPNLYTVKISTDSDEYEQTYGIREVKVENNKLLLNGKSVFLKGFGKHEDFYIIGKGFNHALTVKDFSLLKWIGANSFRTSHYPYDENILDMADREGILVIDETPFVGLNERNYTDSVLNKAVSVINELIKRDKNHPSVIMWSLANEPIAESENAEHFFKIMAETARGLDKTRPITYVAYREPEQNAGMKYYDVVCINKYYGWYEYPGQLEASMPEFLSCAERFYKAYGKGIILTEFGADAISGMHTNPPQMFSEEYQAEMIKTQYEAFKKLPYAIGTHIWAFADFKTNQATRRIIFNRKGVFTRERDPKMAAYMLKDLWNSEKK